MPQGPSTNQVLERHKSGGTSIAHIPYKIFRLNSIKKAKMN